MFRNRQSKKPGDDLYKNFKANFPQMGKSTVKSTAPAPVATSLAADALEAPPISTRPVAAHHVDVKDADPTPLGSNEPWNFSSSGLTPSMMDPDSQSFDLFANQMSGYYTPTSGGANTCYQSQAGDLHTPFGMSLGTPLSMPTSEGTLHAGQQVTSFQSFQPQIPQFMHQQHPFHNVNPFQMPQQQGFPPHHFTHQASYEPMEGPVGESPVDDMGMDVSMHHPSSEVMFHQPQGAQQAMAPPTFHPSGDKFRYHVTLNAPTAMTKHTDEIPVTYLNKGQAYTLNVVDTNIQQSNGPVRYRTFVRVSFEDEQQRAKPSACWQLWKEGRGTNEAHHRGGRLQAVEYVESGQLGNAEDPSKPRIELESASFDGFCVLWSPPAGAFECPISVRFNFLSTDFSHSKGVKGIPVRLCAKTEMIEGVLPNISKPSESEVCFGKVKLFRDHGAERKLSNDVAHVKKTIDKLNQQIAQIESGMKDFGKRKRGSIAKPTVDDRPGKVAKHRRTWSLTSGTSNNGRGSAEEDLHVKLMTLQDMFTSTRPASILYLRGGDLDDPDLHPVKLSGEPMPLVHTNTSESSTWERLSTQTGPSPSMASPTPSSRSLSRSRRDSTLQQPTPFGGPSRENSNDWPSKQQPATVETSMTNPQNLASPPDNPPVKVQTRSPTSGETSGWVEAVGIDTSYQPPSDRPVKPIACFYVQPHVVGRPMLDDYHRAIYLTQRNLKDFVRVLSMKCAIEPTKVLRTVRISRQGLHILVDDECVREIPDGQDMRAEFCESHNEHPETVKREWDASAPSDMQCDGDVPTLENLSTSGYVLKLFF